MTASTPTLRERVKAAIEAHVQRDLDGLVAWANEDGATDAILALLADAGGAPQQHVCTRCGYVAVSQDAALTRAPRPETCIACDSGYHDFVEISGVRHHKLTINGGDYVVPCGAPRPETGGHSACASCGRAYVGDSDTVLMRVNVKAQPGVFLCQRCLGEVRYVPPERARQETAGEQG